MAPAEAREARYITVQTAVKQTPGIQAARYYDRTFQSVYQEGEGMKGKTWSFLRARTKEQAKDTGMALVLLLLLLALILHLSVLIPIAIVLLVIDMLVPSLFRPLAIVWFGGSELLGNLMSRVLLTIAFLVIITPIGLIRRILGKDTLLLRLFKSNEESVMKVRNHTFSASDLENPF
jgi:hypothetical protein